MNAPSGKITFKNGAINGMLVVVKSMKPINDDRIIINIPLKFSGDEASW